MKAPTRSENYTQGLGLFSELNAQLGWRYSAFLAVHLLMGIVTLLPLAYYAYVASRGGQPTPGFGIVVLMLGVAIAVVKGLAGFLTAVLAEVMRVRVEWQLRRSLIHRLSVLSLAHNELSAKDSKFSRIRHDLKSLEDLLVEIFPHFGQYLMMFFALVGLMAAKSIFWSLVLVVSGVVLFLVSYFAQTFAAGQLRRLRMVRASGLELLIESLDGLRTIRSHGMEPYIQRRFDRKQLEANAQSLSTVKALAMNLGGIEFATYASVAAFLAFAMAHYSGIISKPVDFILVSFSTGLLFNSVSRIAQLLLDARDIVHKNTLFSLMKPEVETSRVGDVIADERAECETITVKDVITEDDENYVGPMNFSVARGQIWVISGMTGSGKTLLLETLAGLRCPNDGSVSYSDKEGRTLFAASKGKLKTLFRLTPPGVFVEQYPYLLESSLRENLTFGNSSRLSDTQLWNMLERVGLFEVVQTWGGLEFVLKNRGEDLSRSERYRIALCRALLLKRPFVFMDEPFSHLDEASIEKVVETLKAEKGNSGIFIASRALPASLQYDGCLQLLSRETAEELPRIAVQVFSPRRSSPSALS